MKKIQRILILIVISLVTFNSTIVGQEAKYDRFDDITKITVKPIQIKIPSIFLLVYGKAIVKSDTSKGNFNKEDIQAIYLVLASDSKNFVFQSDYKVKAIIDEERLEFPSVEWKGAKVDINTIRIGNPIIVARERVDIRMTLDELKKIVSAKSAEFRVGKVEIALTSAVQEELKKLVNFLESSKQQNS